MGIFIQWVHLIAMAVALGGLGFLFIILIPSLRTLSGEQREVFSKTASHRIRWVMLIAVSVLLLSGLYNLRRYYWELPWGTAWTFLAIKVGLSFALFGIVLALNVRLRWFEPLRARRRFWLLVAFILGVVITMISAYLRRG